VLFLFDAIKMMISYLKFPGKSTMIGMSAFGDY